MPSRTLHQAAAGKEEPLSFKHARAEATGLPPDSVDLVSMCLVAHELPQAATQAILREGFRILKPGGVFAVSAVPLQMHSLQRQ